MKYFVIWLALLGFYMTLFKVAAKEDKQLEKLWREERMDIGEAIKEQLDLNQKSKKKEKK
ncbi:TPA: hypothetical protein ACOTG0_002064 [Clostridium perfringens]|nr:hypothetical protein phiCPD_00068 [Clostridium phage phiCp-D]